MKEEKAKSVKTNEEIRVLLFSNGSTGMIKTNKVKEMLESNHKAEMVLKKPWILLYAEYLKTKGIDPTKINYVMPNGFEASIIDDGKGGYTWRVP